METGVRSGALPPGAPLPPVRALAADLGVAPATVAAAYRDLRQRGVVETAGRNGTRVRPQPPVVSRIAHRVPPAPGTTDLSAGEPDTALQPHLGPLLRRLATPADRPARYADAGPLPGLTRLAADRLIADGVPARPDAVAVTSGALDAVERLLTAHLRPGDRVAVEDPGWANLIDLVAALSMEAVALPVDDEGPTVDGLRRALAAGVAAVVVTSRAHNPTGAAVTAARAKQLRPLLAASPDTLLIEDDHAAELATVPLAPLAGAGARWAFVRSASKPYGADLRLAIVAGDDATIARVQGRMRLGAGWVSTVLQQLVMLMWSDESVRAQVARAKQEYARRREALLAALRQRGVTAVGRTGINVWVPVDHESVVVAALMERGWAVSPGSLYRQVTPPGVRVSIGALRLSDVDALADAVVDAVAPRPMVGTSR